jgi:RNA polymerase sigma-70 factor (ECF subfamily)
MIRSAPNLEAPAPELAPGTLDRARAHDPKAIEQLFIAHAPSIERVIGRLVGPTPDLEDLVQTAFLEALQALHRFRGEASLKTWLTSIAVHVAQHHLRAGRVRRHVALEAVPEERLAPTPSDQAHRLDERRLAARLHVLLDRISAPKRIALLLFVVEGRSVEEVASLMGASQTATRSRVFFAKRELRALLTSAPDLRELVDGYLGRQQEPSND